MAQSQGSKRVAKANPEMQAVLANIDSLVDELQSLSMADGLGDGGGDLTQEPPPVRGMASASKTEEPFRTPAAPQVATEPKAPANQAGMANWQGDEPEDQLKKAMKIMKDAGYNFDKPEDKEEKDEVEKALKLMKSIMSTPSEGPEANEDGEERLEDMSEVDEENIEEVKKALAKILGLGGKSIRKSSAPKSHLAQSINALTTVAKSLADKVQAQDAILAEVLEGLGIANAVTKDDAPQNQGGNRSVQKAQGNGPVMQYGNEFAEVLGQAVAKAIAPIAQAQQNANRPSGWNTESEVRKNLGEVTVGLGQIAGTQWGDNRVGPAKE